MQLQIEAALEDCRARFKFKCGGKHTHGNKAEANVHLKRIDQRKGQKLVAYKCSHGASHWHAGTER